jgi:hypothetical protein
MMQKRLIHTVTALALTALSTLALAQTPARVGRIALTQGNVTIAGDVGAVSESALVNWPVTSNNTITTARGARTELRIGSTSIRLDGDSSLEVDELDDDNLRLRLNYGSASVRVVDANVLNSFEIATPQALLRMREPGRMRIDTERQRDTTSVTVFDGLGLIDAAGGTLPLRAGKRADIVNDDIDTGTASRDNFDDWALGRDQYQDRSTSARYVTSDMTGYEDLDRYGAWSQDAEYGALWIPQVDNAWAPYRDGRWTWLDPWGWTWVDNAPWGYAPFHYGRWVQVNRRWAWAPGHHGGRPVWAPALVGWVGGNASFGGRQQPGQGWYPLSPRDRFVPGYRASQDHIARLNFGPRRDDGRRDGDGRRPGLTVLPQGQFGQRGQVVVPRQNRDGLGGAVLGAAALAAMQPPRPPQAQILGNDRGHDRRNDRGGERRDDDRRSDRGNDRRNEGLGGAMRDATRDVTRQNMPAQPNQFNPQPRQPVTIATPPPQLPGTNTPRAPVMPNMPEPRQPVTIMTPAPVMPNQNQNQFQNAPQRFEHRDGRDRDGRFDGRFDGRNDNRNDGRNDSRNDGRNPRPQFQAQPQQPVQAQPVRPPVQQPAPQPAPVAQPAPQPQRNEGGMAGMLRNAARDARQQAAPAPAPAPAPAAVAAPAARPEARQEARQERGGNGRGEGRGEGRNQQER